jgi:flagellar hook-basal body complex protein FliE
MDLTKAGQSVIGGIGGIGSVGGASSGNDAMGSFADVLKGMVNQTIDAQKTAEQLSFAAANGDPVALQDVVQAVSKAELTLQTLVTVRDRAVEAYQQIMQMPV